MIPFSPKQQKTIAVAVTFLATAVIVASIGGIAWSAFRLVRAFSGVLLPLVAAVVAALVLKPVYLWLHQRCRLPRILAVGALYALILLPALVCTLFLLSIAVEQGRELCHSLPVWLATGVDTRFPALMEFWRTHDLENRLRECLRTHWDLVGSWLQTAGLAALFAGASVFQVLAGLLSWFVFPVYLTFFLMAEPPRPQVVAANLGFLKPRTREHAQFLATELVGLLVSFFRGQLLIALCQSVLFAVGFELVGLRYGWLLGILMGMLNLVPYLGSMLGLAMTLPTALFQDGGGWRQVALTLLVIGMVGAVESYVLTPRIMGQRTGLHPVAIIFSLFFWGAVFGGVFGMILGIPLTAFVVVFWRLLRRHYFTEVV